MKNIFLSSALFSILFSIVSCAAAETSTAQPLSVLKRISEQLSYLREVAPSEDPEGFVLKEVNIFEARKPLTDFLLGLMLWTATQRDLLPSECMGLTGDQLERLSFDSKKIGYDGPHYSVTFNAEKKICTLEMGEASFEDPHSEKTYSQEKKTFTFSLKDDANIANALSSFRRFYAILCNSGEPKFFPAQVGLIIGLFIQNITTKSKSDEPIILKMINKFLARALYSRSTKGDSYHYPTALNINYPEKDFLPLYNAITKAHFYCDCPVGKYSNPPPLNSKEITTVTIFVPTTSSSTSGPSSCPPSAFDSYSSGPSSSTSGPSSCHPSALSEHTSGDFK